jgi:hypothetical protein
MKAALAKFVLALATASALGCGGARQEPQTPEEELQRAKTKLHDAVMRCITSRRSGSHTGDYLLILTLAADGTVKEAKVEAVGAHQNPSLARCIENRATKVPFPAVGQDNFRLELPLRWATGVE